MMLSKASLRLNARSGRAARLAYSLVIRQRPPFSPAARLLPVAASRRPLFDRDNEDASQAGGRLTDDGELLSEAGDALPEALGDADQWGDLAARNFMATQPSSDPRGPSQLVGAAGAAGAAGSNPWGEGDVDSLPPDYWNTDKERVYLVGLALKSERKKVDTYSVAESLEELAQLADTAGCRVTGRTFQVLGRPDVATFIGSGKVEEVKQAVRITRSETVIFDAELTPAQLRNLERALGNPGVYAGADGSVRIADRTALILDIFSQRARTREGQLQVQLAQVEYQLPRLTRMWSHLDRVGGGGQVKGSGEKQIEIDKRLLKEKAAGLRRELDAVRTHRRLARDRRQETAIPVVALVGYTNAGKSTLMNRLTQAGVLAEDRLFATLDPTTRKLRLAAPDSTTKTTTTTSTSSMNSIDSTVPAEAAAEGADAASAAAAAAASSTREVLLSDTVGFIQKLPTQLVAAFRATLEEVTGAALLLHMVDISHPNASAQMAAVHEVLFEISGANDVPIFTAWNKVDAADDPAALRARAAALPDTFCVSARTGEGLPELLAAISSKLQESLVEMDVLLPYAAGDLVEEAHRCGSVKATEFTEEGTRLRVVVPPQLAGRLRRHMVAGTAAGVVGTAGSRQQQDDAAAVVAPA